MQESKLDQCAAREYLKLWQDWGLESLSDVETDLFRWLRDSSPATASAQPELGTTLDQIRTNLGAGCGSSFCVPGKPLVFGEGDPRAKLMFVADAPKPADGEAGRPFVGPDGQLLTKIIEAMGYSRNQVYLTCLVKCRPPEDATPGAEDVHRCAAYLRAQIAAVRPRCVVALGKTVATALTGQNESLDTLRGKFHPLIWDDRIVVMPTYPPDLLLRNPAAKRSVWEDMKHVIHRLEETG